MELPEIQKLMDDIENLTNELNRKKEELTKLMCQHTNAQQESKSLTSSDISRYSRQILLPNVGLKGQESLKKSSVLIVGAGGLGCPAALYLAAAGVGRIGIVDYDVVELNNLHRQILHSEIDVGVTKVTSAAYKIKSLNGDVTVNMYCTQLDSNNALSLLASYAVVLDATDNVATRYLLNDACVLGGKPLVSGSALQMEGQLTVYHHLGAPCYRCLFPFPPDPGTVNNCSSSGVLGPVCGVIGVLQALETTKVILQSNDVLAGRMLLFDGTDTTFRCIKLRKKKLDCDVCGINPKIKRLIDYEQFCNSVANDKGTSLSLLNKDERISVSELSNIRSMNKPHLLVDVRSPAEFDMCNLSGSLNLHISKLDSDFSTLVNELNTLKKVASDPKVIFICRRGNDSQLAVNSLKSKLAVKSVYDVEGGLHAWSKFIDPNFPVY